MDSTREQHPPSDFLSSSLYPPQSLRSDLLSSALTAQLLVTLSPEDLATDELRQARQTINKADRESRRTDWLEEHKGKIQVKCLRETVLLHI